MILKGNQRAGGRQMALHLLNGEQNEHVDVHQVRGFIAEDVLGALNEAYALSKGTKCKQFMYSLSLNPPQDQEVGTEVFEQTIDKIEDRLGLSGQPRVVVFHEKEGRRHAHCVWSRIDIDQMKAINMSNDRRKLNALSKSLYLEHGWKLPDGFKNKNKTNPLNFTREEWQQAKRIGRNAADIKSELQECWAISDSKRSFENALKDSGYILAKGDKRSYVVIDALGEIYSLPRQLGKKKKDLEARLGTHENLPSVDEAKTIMAKTLSPIYKKYLDDLAERHSQEQAPLHKEKQEMSYAHNKMREDLEAQQRKRWHEEENTRASRVRYGFKGLWDKLSGRYWKVRKQNEKEAHACYMRDKKQKDALIQKNLAERYDLQMKLYLLRQQQEEERKMLIKDFSYASFEKDEQVFDHSISHDYDLYADQDYDGPELEID